eukprot:2832058-Pleurochrysis_carterae.AAC.1
MKQVNDFNDDYLPLAEMDNEMLLCLYTTAINASNVLPPIKNYKDNGNYSQRLGVHFDNCQGHVCTLIFSLVALFDLELKVNEVVKAFTGVPLCNADFYCEQIKEFEVYDRTTCEK